MSQEKSQAAVELGRKRWAGVSAEQRAEIMAELRAKRTGKRWTAEERAAFGRRMAELRAAKRGKQAD